MNNRFVKGMDVTNHCFNLGRQEQQYWEMKKLRMQFTERKHSINYPKGDDLNLPKNMLP